MSTEAMEVGGEVARALSQRELISASAWQLADPEGRASPTFLIMMKCNL